jgi:MFS family permease
VSAPLPRTIRVGIRARHGCPRGAPTASADATQHLTDLSTRHTGGVLDPVKEALRSANVRWSVVLIFLFLWAEAGAVTFLTVQLVHSGVDLALAALLSGVSGLTGWIGQVVWGTWSDHAGRKLAIRSLIIGWTVTLLAMLLITSPASAWIVLLAWGLFRNAPFPVVHALLIDSVPKAAGTAMGIMIGLALGGSGAPAAPIAGLIIDTWGFDVHYAVLAAICLLGLIPLARMSETVGVTGQEKLV